MSSYRIDDEPQPGALAQVAVNPVWPLLAVMFGGAFVSWPWFAVNGFAVGSPYRRKELLWAIGGFAGSAAIVLAIFALAGAEVLEGLAIRYALIGLTVWKLAVSYWLYTLQSRSFGLFEHFGGTVRNGIAILFVAYFLRRPVLSAVPAFWSWVLG